MADPAPAELAKRVLRREWEHLSADERRVIDAVLHRRSVVRNIGREFSEGRTFGQRMADRIAAFGGSWVFILTFLGLLVAWTSVNTLLLDPRHLAFDPYPYIFLNLLLSMLAALQAPVITMSQNRQAAKDRLDASHDYEVNLKAELEIRELREAIDALRQRQWEDLVALQREQIRLLELILDTARPSDSSRAGGG